jgi:hypothetical protein
MSGPRFVALAALLAVMTLSGCVPEPGMEPSPSTPAGDSPTPSESQPPSASPSASPSGEQPESPTDPGDPATGAITIEYPLAGATVPVPFVANGTANTFEAALTIDAVDGSGMQMCVRHLTATSGSGTRGTWQGMLAFPPEEDPLAVTMRAYAFSARDGSMVDLVEFPVLISPERPDIIVTNPRCGDVYEPGGLMLLTGTAAVFEAALTIELRDGRRAIMSLPVTADECCIESQFTARLTLPSDLSSGFYDVAAYSLSAMDGSVENEFVVQIEVRA